MVRLYWDIVIVGATFGVALIFYHGCSRLSVNPLAGKVMDIHTVHHVAVSVAE